MQRDLHLVRREPRVREEGDLQRKLGLLIGRQSRTLWLRAGLESGSLRRFAILDGVERKSIFSRSEAIELRLAKPAHFKPSPQGASIRPVSRDGKWGAFGRRDFRLLWSARMASQFADGLLQAALIATVVFSPSKAGTVEKFAEALAIIYVPYSVVGPFIGTFIDRWSRRRILLLTPLLRAACVIPLALTHGADLPWWAVSGTLLVFSANRFFLATAAAVVPRMVTTDELVTANSVSIVGGTVAAFVGLFAGGLVADHIGQHALVIGSAILWCMTSATASRISRDLVAHRGEASGSPTHLRQGLAAGGRDLIAGLHRLRRTPRASWPITSIVLDQVIQGYVLVISLFVFKDRFEGGIGSFSWLAGAGALGIFIGIATVNRVGQRLPKERLVALGFLLAGTGLVANAIKVVPATAMLSALVLGLTFAWKKVTVDTMVQEAVPDTYRGRVFSVYDVFFNLARVIAGYAAVVLLPRLDVVGSLLVFGALSLAWVPVLPWALRRIPEFAVHWSADADPQPFEVVRGGPAEAVTSVLADASEARDSGRIRTMRLALDDGSVIDIEHVQPNGSWLLLDEI